MSRALDALVAERVMGWKRLGALFETRPLHRPSKDFPGEIFNDFDGKGPHDYLEHPEHSDPGCRVRVAFCGCESTADLSPYSTDIRAAWEVLRELVQRGKRLDPMGWSGLLTMTEPMAATAICLAALRAVGVSEEELKQWPAVAPPSSPEHSKRSTRNSA